MAKDILIVGESGSGKSTSFRNLPPKETFIISCSKDDLPFKGSGKNYTKWSSDNKKGNFIKTSNPNTIIKTLQWIDKNRDDIKYIIIDDGNYIMQDMFIDTAEQKGYQKYTDIGVAFARVIKAGKNLSDSKTFIISMHAETYVSESGAKIRKAKTVGVCSH